MGCVSGSPKEPEDPANGNQVDGDDPDAAEIAKRQRRKLSVAPQHVGGGQQKEAPPPGEDEKNGKEPAALSEVEAKAKGTLRHALKTKKGVVPYNRNKVNQDRAIVKFAVQNDPAISLFGVMDGHGEFGHYVASFVQEKLPVAIANQKDLKTDTEKAIIAATAKMCAELANTTINVAFSGTTAVFAVKINNKLFVANIGDSRCVLCRQSGGGELEAIGLSIDQKPELPKEKARILKAGGRVEPLPGPPGEDCGPPRVWLAEVDVPGLAMSRSIGDEVSQTVGVISVPEVIEHDIKENDIFAVWASDGVWEFVSNEEAVAIIWKSRHDLKEAAEKLVEESNKRWRQEEEVVDDITCVIVAFNDPK